MIRAHRAVAVLLAVLLAGLVACGGPEPDDAGDRPPEASTATVAPTITASGLGCLRVGAPADSVRSACPSTRDTTIQLEGDAQAALVVDVGGATALAEIVDGRVWRISLDERGPTTADSMGVGTLARRLAEHPGARTATGEGRYYVLLPDRCGLSFRLDGVASGRAGEGLGPGALPDSVRVDRILILGPCG